MTRTEIALARTRIASRHKSATIFSLHAFSYYFFSFLLYDALDMRFRRFYISSTLGGKCKHACWKKNQSDDSAGGRA
jgi:hypothetical protein